MSKNTNIFQPDNLNKYPIFQYFNNCYYLNLTKYCYLLQNFQIKIITVEEYLKKLDTLPIIESVEIQPFASYIYKTSNKIEHTNAGIIINEPIIKNLKLTESEQLAAIAHEIGHILFFFLENKEDYPGPNGEEIYCDSIACKIGLSAEMLSIIIKLINDKNYSEFSCSLYIRKNILKHCR